jgi:hypothetical protein
MFSPKVNSRSGLLSSVHAFEPGIDLALGLVSRHAVALLKPAAELRALTLDDVEIVVGELAPLLLSLAFELFPIAFNSIPIHRASPVSFSRLCCFPGVVFRSVGGNVQPENPARQQKFRRADPRAIAEKDARPLLKKTRA